ncbi:MerR family transcriptional regulator [Pseudodesulfovibrio nedwellii]|uniref:MerR family transcriptional regulator n=1 Tax=Pseudodesulfovibrio nedwellii TaxID=2973072 RepID=A0ABM8B2V8_9BACT|nr:MerR family transcriptional regulator [Pseudodesulfovibrio nedwellii]BDQ38110.1 MerR family transcriptional regulator [Pseudodesulfovibrio nedwellii]
MKIRFSTGEMAKHFGISKQTLIYYDTIGLFRPRWTNEETGYRSYSIEQNEILDTILALKNLGMPLKKIRDYLNLPTIEERICLLEKQEERIKNKIKVITRARKRVNSMLAAFRDRSKIVPFEMGVKRVEQRSLFSESVSEPYDLYQLEIAIKRLLERTQVRGDTDLHEFMGVVDAPAVNVRLFMKVGQYVKSGGNDRLEAGDYAYIYHKGSYDTVYLSQKKLENFMEEMGLEKVGLIYENIMLDYLAVSNEDEYLIEVMVPVVRRSS